MPNQWPEIPTTITWIALVRVQVKIPHLVINPNNPLTRNQLDAV